MVWDHEIAGPSPVLPTTWRLRGIGLTRLPFTQKITGSSPVAATKTIHPGGWRQQIGDIRIAGYPETTMQYLSEVWN